MLSSINQEYKGVKPALKGRELFSRTLKDTYAMNPFSWHLLAAGGCVVASASMPTGNQAVLSVLEEVHALERPSFGVGFDLTASYGQDIRF